MAPQRNTLRLIRFSLGVVLFASYILLLAHRQSYTGVPRVIGFQVPFLRIPQLIVTAPYSVIIYISGLLLSLSFALGYWTSLCGIALLVLHCFFNGGAFPFGWEPLIDPFLACLIVAFAKGVQSHWPLRLMKISACVVMAWIAWSQIGLYPWLDTETVMRYVSHSPFGRVSSNFRGFEPLVEIFGGFAWLLQLTVPAVLWHRPLGKYWAVLLLFFEVLLVVFTPLAFWNLMAMVAVIPFLPERWLTLKKSDWIPQLPEFKRTWRGISFVFLMSIVICTVFDRNIAEQFDIFTKIGSVKVEKTYEIATNPFVKFGNLILFNSVWKMYSPTWRHVVWIEWVVKNPDGAVTHWPEENFSPEYRMHRRTWLEAVWTDFKKEKVFVGMLSNDEAKVAYAKYLCHVITDKTGIKPVSIQPEIFSFDIRGPEENWSLRDQKFERDEKKSETLCD